MSRVTHIAHLPLKLAVVPTMVMRWLRVAGIPVTPFDVVATTDQLQGEIVLYDSRSAASRNSVEAARDSLAHLIDVAPLLSTHLNEEQSTQLWHAGTEIQPASVSQGRIFLERLKQKIDKQGGCWIRLADYPFPFQSVLCVGTVPEEALEANRDIVFAPFPALSIGNESNDNIEQSDEIKIAQNRYAGGLPFCTPVNKSSDSLFRLEAPPKEFPLLWRTTFTDFLHWRRLRMQVNFEVTLSNSVYHIESNSQFEKYRPQVELWRGGHVASFRLFGAGMSIREEGLVFQQEQGRHPSGFSAHLLHGESLIQEHELDLQISNPPQHRINEPRSLAGT